MRLREDVEMRGIGEVLKEIQCSIPDGATQLYDAGCTITIPILVGDDLAQVSHVILW